MSDWSNIHQAIGNLGQTKRGAMSPLIEAHRNRGKILGEGLGRIGDTLGRIGDKRFATSEREAGEEFIAEQAKKAKGYFDESGVYHPGTDVGGSIASMQAKTIEELKLMFPTVDEATLTRFLEQLKAIGGAEGDVEAETAGKVQEATFMHPWEQEGFENIEAWMAYHKDDPMWMKYGFDNLDDWKAWQTEMANIGIKVSDDDDNFLIKANLYLDAVKGQHSNRFTDQATQLPKGFLDMTTDDQEYLMAQWKASVKFDAEATELIDWFSQKFSQPGSDGVEPTDPLSNMRQFILSDLKPTQYPPITGRSVGMAILGGRDPSFDEQPTGTPGYTAEEDTKYTNTINQIVNDAQITMDQIREVNIAADLLKKPNTTRAESETAEATLRKIANALQLIIDL